MNRGIFLSSAGMTGVSALLPPAVLVTGAEAARPEPFQWNKPDLTFSVEFSADKLRQKSLLRASYSKAGRNRLRLPESRRRFISAVKTRPMLA